MNGKPFWEQNLYLQSSFRAMFTCVYEKLKRLSQYRDSKLVPLDEGIVEEFDSLLARGKEIAWALCHPPVMHEDCTRTVKIMSEAEGFTMWAGSFMDRLLLALLASPQRADDSFSSQEDGQNKKSS